MKHDNFGLIYASICFLTHKIIESREMKDESKDPDTIDGAVRVAQLVNCSSFKKALGFLTLGFLIIFVILVYLLKRLFVRLIFTLGYHINLSYIMFRTWLILPDQSGHHRLELLVSHNLYINM